MSSASRSSLRLIPFDRPTVVSYDDISVEYNAIPGDQWIDKLRFAFQEVDPGHTERLSLDQWMSSRLRFVIFDKRQSDQEFGDIHEYIDSDGDQMVSWTELVEYLVSHNSVDGQSDGERLILTSRAPATVPESSFTRRSRGKAKTLSHTCIRAHYAGYLGCVLILTEYTLTYWDITDCRMIREFSEGDAPFCDFCLIPRIHKIAISKQNRQIIFIDTRSYEKIDFCISATVNSHFLPRMTIAEASAALKSVQNRRKVPLFNTPTAIAALPNDSLLFVGDSDGRMEVFNIFPSREQQSGWYFSRFHVAIVHSKPVTQIEWVQEGEFFVHRRLTGQLSSGSIIADIAKFTSATFTKTLRYRQLSSSSATPRISISPLQHPIATSAAGESGHLCKFPSQSI
jgi:hypothetical protein